MAYTYFKNINNIKKEEINDLNFVRIEKSKKYQIENDRLLCLAAGIALNEGLKDLKLKEKNLLIEYNENGKPYFKNRNDIKFNLSHTKNMAIAVISNNEVGCDIETIRKYNDKLVKKYFSKEEQDFINNSNDKDIAFTRIWVLKEAFFKAVGTGIIQNMNEISIIPFDNGININQQIDDRNRFLEAFFIENEYFVAICEEIRI